MQLEPTFKKGQAIKTKSCRCFYVAARDSYIRKVHGAKNVWIDREFVKLEGLRSGASTKNLILN